MMTVVKFPTNAEIEDMPEAIDVEIEHLFDYMDDRIEDGADGTILIMAMTIILKMITDSEGMSEALH